MSDVTTNIDELMKNIGDSYKNLFNNTTLKRGMQRAADKMRESVLDQIQTPRRGSFGNKGYLSQSGQLNSTLRTQDGEVLSGKTSIKAGYGNVDDLNQQTKRPAQRATFHTRGEDHDTVVSLRPEPVLPAWIIMEFGRKSGTGGASPAGIPKQFQVQGYGGRDTTKQFLFGPSETKHNRKPVFFMASQQSIMEHYGKKANLRPHPGIQAQSFFRDGFKRAIPYIQEEIPDALEMALIQELKSRGWEMRFY